MADRKIKLKDQLGRVVRLDDGASGATLGKNLYGADGKLLTADQIINQPATKPGPAATIWKLIREIPDNIVKLAALAGKGFAVRRDDGEWALRTLQPGDGIDIANGDGEDGDPTISLEDLPDSGVGALLAITRDAKGRVSATRVATITGTAGQIDVANGDAAAGLPTLRLSDPVLDSLAMAESAVQSVVAGAGISVNNADPQNPIVTATGGGGGGGTVDAIVPGPGVDVDATDPANPIVSVEATVVSGAADGATAVQPADSVTTLSMATARLLGRSAAGAGAVQEIILGTNLSFSGSTLNAAGIGVNSVVAGSNVTVDNTDPANPVVAANLTAARVPNTQSVTSSATVTPTFSNDIVTITAQAAALTLANPTGTAIANLGMVIRIKDNGTARAITYGTQYRPIGVTLPTTTVATKTTYLGLIYNANDTTWDVVAVGTQA